MMGLVIRTRTILRLRGRESETAKEQEEEICDVGYGMMAYCIAMGTFWTYHYLLKDLVAHGLLAMEPDIGDIGGRTKMGGGYAVGSTPCFSSVIELCKKRRLFSYASDRKTPQCHICPTPTHKVCDAYDPQMQLVSVQFMVKASNFLGYTTLISRRVKHELNLQPF